MKWPRLSLRPPSARVEMQRYLDASLSLASLPAEALTPALWRRAATEWWPTALRIGAHRLPLGILFDIGALLDRQSVGWRAGEGALAGYRQAVRRLALEHYQHDGVATTTLAATLRALLPEGRAAESLIPPSPIALETLSSVLHERSAHPSEIAEFQGEAAQDPGWHRHVLSWLELVTPQLAALREPPLPGEILLEGFDGTPQLLSLELDLLEQLVPLPSAPLQLDGASHTRLPGQLRHRQRLGHTHPGVDGVEFTDSLERAHFWQLCLGRRFLVERMAARELSAYRAPHTAGQRASTCCVVAWFDPSSVASDGLATQRPSYAAGKRLAAQLFLELLSLAGRLGLDEIDMSLVSLPALRPPSFVSPRRARQQGFSSQASGGSDGLALLKSLPLLAGFYSRPAHRPTIAETCASAGLWGHGLGLVLAKSLMDALPRAARPAETCVVLLIIPRSVWSALEPLGGLPEAARRVRVQLDALLRPKLPVHASVLAVHDEQGEPCALAEASSSDPRPHLTLLEGTSSRYTCVRSMMKAVIASSLGAS